MKPFAKHLTRTKPMWLYIENGKVKGPVSQEKMSRLIEEGRVSRSSKIAKQQTDTASSAAAVNRRCGGWLYWPSTGRLECVMGLCSFGCRPELWQLGAEP